MSHDRSRRVKKLFEQARTLDDAARAALLEEQCRDDPDLRHEVETLLEAFREDTDFLVHPVFGDALNVHQAADRMAQAAATGAPPEEREAATDVLIGRSIGRYRLVSRIGEGGMGAVYLAERADESYTKNVAVKVIKRGMDSEAIVRRFEQERQILANLDHPGIARLIDGGMTDDGRPYIIMEHVSGTRIDQYCDKNAMTIDQRIDLFREVCEAVHAAHQSLVVHRDLKPSNILVTDDRRVKLLDFGIAKTLDPEGVNSTERDRTSITMTLPHERRLTLRYASPEQTTGAPVTTASDVYSLGVILFELLTGSSPHAMSGTDDESMQRVIRDEDPLRPSTAVHRITAEQATDAIDTRARLRRLDPRSLAKRLHGDLDTIVLMCLRKDPARRYGSAQQLAEDMSRYQRGLPVVARPDTWRYRTGKFLHRHALGVSGAMLIVLALTGLLAFSVVSYVEAREAEAAMALERDRAMQSEAIAEQQRAEAEAQAAIAEAVNRFLNEDLLGAADVSEAGGRDVTVREVLDSAARAVETAFLDHAEVEAAVRLTIGEAYRSLGLYDEATTHIERAIALNTAERGEEHHETLLAHKARALLLRDMGEYRDAEPLLRNVTEALEQSFGLDDRRTLEAQLQLAFLWHLQDQIDASKALFEDVVERSTTLFGERDRLTIEAMSNLASTYESRGKYDEAKPLLIRTIELSREELGDDHRRTVSTRGTLATLYHSTGRFEEAEVILEELIERQKRILGERHPSTLTAKSNLASIYAALGKHDEAEALHKHTLELRNEILGEDHPRTLSTLNNLATLYLNQGRLADAAPLLERAYHARRDKLGPIHAETMNAMNSLGLVYRVLGQYDEAEQMYSELAELRREVHGERHEQTISAIHHLGRVYRQMERYEESLELTEGNLEIASDILPEDNWQHARYLAAHGESLQGLGRHAEAVEFLERSHEHYKRIIGPTHALTMGVLHTLGQSHLELEQFDQAREVYTTLLDLRRDTFGERDEQTLAAMHFLAQVYRGLEQFGESLKLTEQLIKWAGDSLPEDDWQHGLYAAAHAASLRGLQQYDDALHVFKQAYETYVRTLDRDDDRILNVVAALAELCEQIGDTARAGEWRAMLDDED